MHWRLGREQRLLAALLVVGVTLVAAAPQISDTASILTRTDRVRSPVEYLPFLQGIWYIERAVGGDLALVHAVFAAVGAALTYVVLRRAGARTALFVGPSLLLMGQNYEPWVGLAVALAAGGSAIAAVVAGSSKVVPGLALIPLLAREPRRVVRAVLGLVAFLVVPAMLAPGALTDAIAIASDRTDTRGTMWALLGISPVTWQPIALLLPMLMPVAWVARRRLSVPSAVALTILVGMAINKVWQPHYILWVTPALALTRVDARAVRALEVTSLGFFLVIWSDLQTSSVVVNSMGAARLAAAGVVAWSLWRSGAAVEDPPPSSAMLAQ